MAKCLKVVGGHENEAWVWPHRGGLIPCGVPPEDYGIERKKKKSKSEKHMVTNPSSKSLWERVSEGKARPPKEITEGKVTS